MEIETPVNPVLLEFECSCVNGTLEATGITDTKAIPTQYQHQCLSCGEVRVFEVKYPRIEFKK